MARNMKESGIMDVCMEKDCSNGSMARATKETTKWMKDRGMVCILGRTALNMLVSGRTAKDMVEV